MQDRHAIGASNRRELSGRFPFVDQVQAKSEVTTMTAARNIALSHLISVHNAEQREQVLVQVVRNAPKKDKSAPIPSKTSGGLQSVKAEVKPGPKTAELVKAGTLDAAGFMQAMRNAGKRANAHGVMLRDESKVREDQIQAIAGYIGYNLAENFGPQEAAARTKANRELSGRPIQGPTREEQRAAARTMLGYVHGMPNDRQRRLANLQARELEAVEAMIQHVKDARDHSRSIVMRQLSIGLARVEKERLETIRTDIQALV